MKTYDVYSSIDRKEWNHQTTTTDPGFIQFLSDFDSVLYWKTENGEAEEPEYFCGECGSDDLDITTWIKLNTGEPAGETESGEYFCNVCEETSKMRHAITKKEKEAEFGLEEHDQ